MGTEVLNKIATYLTFNLEEEVYALDVLKVKEVLELTKITKVPKTPRFMRGVINLRGNVVPVVDLKYKFGMGDTEETVRTCIIVMEVAIDNEIKVIGAMADAVKEVINLEPEQIEPSPYLGTKVNIEFINGMGKIGDEFIIILDIDKIFSEDEFQAVSSSAKKVEGEILKEK
jgi:purine-binding chemotaxis protein CheW